MDWDIGHNMLVKGFGVVPDCTISVDIGTLVELTSYVPYGIYGPSGG